MTSQNGETSRSCVIIISLLGSMGRLITMWFDPSYFIYHVGLSENNTLILISPLASKESIITMCFYPSYFYRSKEEKNMLKSKSSKNKILDGFVELLEKIKWKIYILIFESN